MSKIRVFRRVTGPLLLILAGCRPAAEPLPSGAIELAEGESRVYGFELGAGRRLRIEAESRHLDQSLRLVAPSGAVLAEIWVPAWRWRPEVLEAITTEDGAYRLVIHAPAAAELASRCRSLEREPEGWSWSWSLGSLGRAFSAGGTPKSGSCALSVSDRFATPEDAAVIAARRHHGRGVAAAECNTPEASRRAASELESALTSWDEVGDPEGHLGLVAGKAETLHWLGMVRTDLGMREPARESFLAALEARRRLEDPGSVADTQYRLADLERRDGQYWSAQSRLRESLEIYRRLGEREPLALIHMSLGLVNRRLSRLPETLEHYEAALALFREVGWPDYERSALKNLGVAYQVLGGDTPRAREYFTAALRKSVDLRKPGEGPSATEAGIYNDVGWGLKQEGDDRGALEQLERAEEIARSVGDARRLATVLDNLARVYLGLGDLERARQLSVETLDSTTDEGQRAGRLISLGMIERRRFESLESPEPSAAAEAAALAGQHLAAALDLARSQGVRRLWAGALYEQARLAAARGELQEALAKTDEAIRLIEAVRASVGTTQLRALYLGQQRDVYELQVELLARSATTDPGALARAFAAHERARSRVTLEGLAESRQRRLDAVDPELLDLRRRLAEELDRLDLARRARRPNAGEVTEQILDLERQLEEVERRIDRALPEIDRRMIAEPLELAEVQNEVLDDDTLLLEFALGTERGFLFAVSQGSLSVHELPPRAEIDDGAVEVYRALTRGEGEGAAAELEAAAVALSEMLLAPVASQLDRFRLVVAPEGALHYVPFAVLPAPGGGRPLVLDHEISYLPSASFLGVSRGRARQARPAARHLTLVADPVFSRHDERLTGDAASPSPDLTGEIARSFEDVGLRRLDRLKGTRQEARAIECQYLSARGLVPSGTACPELDGEVADHPLSCRTLAAEECLVALDFAASRELLASAELGRYRILHFATHGVVNERHPGLSGLVLSLVDPRARPVDGFLRLHDVEQLDLSAELVVLSGCRTALGRQVRGEGLLSLTRGFLATGAQRVMASLWPVEDRSTAALMARFYRGLYADGLAPPAALRAAQLALLQGDGSAEEHWRSPYYWAPFVLIGEWRPLGDLEEAGETKIVEPRVARNDQHEGGVS